MEMMMMVMILLLTLWEGRSCGWCLSWQGKHQQPEYCEDVVPESIYVNTGRCSPIEVFLNTKRNISRSSPCVFSMLEVFGPWHYAAVAVQYWWLISSTKVSSGAFGRLWSSWHGLVTIMGPALKKCCCSVRDISKGVHFCNNNLRPSQYVWRKIVLVVVLIEKIAKGITDPRPWVPWLIQHF